MCIAIPWFGYQSTGFSLVYFTILQILEFGNVGSTPTFLYFDLHDSYFCSEIKNFSQSHFTSLAKSLILH